MLGDAHWLKQEAGKPAFPDLLWSRPENRALAGKLLIVGGNAFEFAAPAEAYAASLNAGVGAVRVLLPDRLKHTVGKVLDVGDFAPSTPSGSFARQALNDLLATASWADGVLLAGDLGRNAETAVLLEKFAEKYSGQLTLTKDAADYFTSTPRGWLRRPATTLVLSFAQLQKLAKTAKFPRAFTFDMGIVRLVETLQEFTTTHDVNIVTKHLDHIFIAAAGQVSTTTLSEPLEVWRVKTAARTSVWWLQNPAKAFESLSTAVYGTPSSET